MGVTILYIVVLAIVAYLLGSIPTAVWVGKAFFKIDVREYGSKNAGATNTIRTLGLPAGLAVFAIDLLKGFVATSLYRVLFHLVPTLNVSWSLFAILFGICAALGAGRVSLRFAALFLPFIRWLRCVRSVCLL